MLALEDVGRFSERHFKGTATLCNTVWHDIFAVFPAIRKNKFSQIKITANIFLGNIHSE